MSDDQGSSSEPSATMFRELKSEYEKDFELKERLDNKASNMITMSGVIAALITGFGMFVLKDVLMPNPLLLGGSILALLIGLVFLIKTIHTAIVSLRVVDYDHVLIWSKFIQDDKFNNAEIRTWKQATQEQFNSRMIKRLFGRE